MIYRYKHYMLLSLLSLVNGSSSLAYKQYHAELPLLLQEAKATQSYLVHFLNTLKLNFPNAVIIDPGIKGLKTIKQLLTTRWSGDASGITDYARATIGVETIFDVYRCLDQILSSDLKIIEVKDYFFKPYPEFYRDINIIFEDPHNKHIGEIQINTLPMLLYKNTEGHDLFDQIRNINANALFEQRPSTNDEIELLEILTGKSMINYNAAFDASLIMKNIYIRLGVYAVIVNDKNEILLTKTQSGTRLIYNFPGGGVDNGEGFADALRRECQEELGAEVAISTLLHSSKQLYPHSDFPYSRMFNLYYEVTLNEPNKIAALDCEGIGWFKLNELPLQNMLDIDKEFIDFFISNNSK